MIIRILGLAMAILATSSVYADEAHFYMGVDFGEFSYSQDNSSTTYDDADGYVLRLGYDFNNWLAVEGHYSTPDDFESSGSGTISGSGYGAFARFNLRFKRATLYAIGGATSANYTGGTETGYAYGVGLDVYGSKDTALTFAYTSYFNHETAASNDIEVSAVSFGITHYIGNRPKIYRRY